MAFVTPDEFMNSPYGGFDLREALVGADNESHAAENFIELVTDHLMAWVDTKSFRNFRWDNLTSFQKEYWKKAIIAQDFQVFYHTTLTTEVFHYRLSGVSNLIFFPSQHDISISEKLRPAKTSNCLH